ncbi:GntR family transcriptional regulator [Phycicoccus ginsengisoli]
MIIDVDPQSAVPTYEQVRAQLAAMVVSGSLPEGTRLPSIRQLASDLDLAPGTVARAYRELEAAGLVSSRVRHGTVVRPVARPTKAAGRAQLEEAARGYALTVLRLGGTEDDAVRALREQLHDLGR